MKSLDMADAQERSSEEENGESVDDIDYEVATHLETQRFPAPKGSHGRGVSRRSWDARKSAGDYDEDNWISKSKVPSTGSMGTTCEADSDVDNRSKSVVQATKRFSPYYTNSEAPTTSSVLHGNSGQLEIDDKSPLPLENWIHGQNANICDLSVDEDTEDHHTAQNAVRYFCEEPRSSSASSADNGYNNANFDRYSYSGKDNTSDVNLGSASLASLARANMMQTLQVHGFK
jgi:hypothetical protein